MSRVALVLLLALLGLVLVAEARAPKRRSPADEPLVTADDIRQKIADAKAKQAARGQNAKQAGHKENFVGSKHAAPRPVRAQAAAAPPKK